MSKKRYKRGDEKRKKKEKKPSSRAPAPQSSFLGGRYFDLTVIVIYGILVAVLFHQFLFSNGMLFGTDSIPSGVFFRGLYRDFVREYHTLPRWDPYILGGLPFIDAMHGDTFYPTSVLKFFMPLHRAMGWKLIIHVFLAGLFVWKSSVPFLPPRDDDCSIGGDDGTSDRDATAGLVSLLRRNIAPQDILGVCFEEWKKSSPSNIRDLGDKLQSVQKVVEEQLAPPARQRNPVQDYQNIQCILTERN